MMPEWRNLTEFDQILAQWIDTLEPKLIKAAAHIVKQGYFGTVGFDSMIYKDQGRQKLAPIIEINARHVMSDIALEIRKKCAPKKHCFFRFLGKKSFVLPRSYKEIQSLLDGIEFKNNCGCMVVSPLEVQHDKEIVRPSRNVFFISANSETELWHIDKELRTRTSFR